MIGRLVRHFASVSFIRIKDDTSEILLGALQWSLPCSSAPLCLNGAVPFNSAPGNVSVCVARPPHHAHCTLSRASGLGGQSVIQQPSCKSHKMRTGQFTQMMSQRSGSKQNMLPVVSAQTDLVQQLR
eukprot:1155101-Amphidinium_carterae.1